MRDSTRPPRLLLTRLANHVILAWGWRRYALAFGAGAVTTLGFAPFHAWPLLFATFPVLVWLIDGSVAGRFGRVFSAAVVGWWFGFGFFVTGLYWTGIALLVDAKTFAWLMPFAVAGLPAGLALLTAFGAALAAALWSPGASRILALAACNDGRGMSARASADGVSLERVRLCADRPAAARAERVGDRALGAHVPRRGDLREPGGAGGRARGYAAALVSARPGRSRPGRAWRLTASSAYQQTRPRSSTA